MENVFSEKLLHPDGPNCLKDKNDNLNNFVPLYTTFGDGARPGRPEARDGRGRAAALSS